MIFNVSVTMNIAYIACIFTQADETSRPFVYCSKLKAMDNVLVSASFGDAINQAADAENVFIIGGGSVYKQALASKQCSRIFLTRIYSKFGCDIKFEFDESLFAVEKESNVQEEKGIKFKFTQ